MQTDHISKSQKKPQVIAFDGVETLTAHVDGLNVYLTVTNNLLHDRGHFHRLNKVAITKLNKFLNEEVPWI